MRSIIIILLGFGLITGCSNEVVNEEQKIKVQIRVDDENNYEDFKEITDNDEVQKVKEIVFDIEWENAKVQMEHPADYRFIFQYKNPNIEAKAASYNLWISPNNDIVEIVMEEDAYAKLSKENSSILIKILTRENLPN
ncbi:hypothetical protein CSE16_12305 [Solibacillus sp. R5-41]|uniref:hypothetical protein n=1 Tax=Solibacillus sp. R5-41 TaxID=2048654 RepID=UPI000C127EBF|nr:hypothetical protein [Solibacillus sp. R5-41]ATP40768.1 hypothetical protein CSE16_12305 [Solibacillus sp. R5-41]